MNIPEAMLGGAILVIFTAGGVWVALQRANKDLNGLGRKVGELKDKDVRAMVTLLVLTNDRKDREFIAKNLLD